MYQELLDIVRNVDEPPADDHISASTDISGPRGYEANMPVVVEESETEFPSFSMKKRGGAADIKGGDTEFDKVINTVLEENKNAAMRDDFSDDDELAPDRGHANPLKDFTFVSPQKRVKGISICTCLN